MKFKTKVILKSTSIFWLCLPIGALIPTVSEYFWIPLIGAILLCVYLVGTIRCNRCGNAFFDKQTGSVRGYLVLQCPHCCHNYDPLPGDEDYAVGRTRE